MKINWKTWIGTFSQYAGLGCAVAASWNSALLHESTAHPWALVTMTAAEWFIAAVMVLISTYSHGTNSIAKVPTATPLNGLLTIEQIEQAIKDRIVADQENLKSGLLDRLGKVKP